MPPLTLKRETPTAKTKRAALPVKELPKILFKKIPRNVFIKAVSSTIEKYNSQYHDFHLKLRIKTGTPSYIQKIHAKEKQVKQKESEERDALENERSVKRFGSVSSYKNAQRIKIRVQQELLEANRTLRALQKDEAVAEYRLLNNERYQKRLTQYKQSLFLRLYKELGEYFPQRTRNEMLSQITNRIINGTRIKGIPELNKKGK